MGCCTKSGLWKAVAIFSMLMSGVYVAASICAILTYHCLFSPSVSAFQMDNTYFTYVVYFYNKDCIDTNSNYVVNYTDSSDRTFKWSVTYLAINTVWFFSSLLLMNAPNYWKTTTGLCLTYPWLFTTFGVLCVDAASSVMYGLDYENLESLDALFKFVGILFGKPDDLSFDYIPLPLIIMVAVFSKLIIGWIMVFISFVIIYRIMVNIGKPKELRLQTKPSIKYYTPSTVSRSALDNQMMELPSLSPNMQYQNGVDNPIYLDDDVAWESQPNSQTRYIIPRVTTRDSRDDIDALERYRRDQPLPRNANSWEMYSTQGSDDYPGVNRRPMIKNPQANHSFDNQPGHVGPWSYVSPEDLPPHTRYAEYPYNPRYTEEEGVGYF